MSYSTAVMNLFVCVGVVIGGGHVSYKIDGLGAERLLCRDRDDRLRRL